MPQRAICILHAFGLVCFLVLSILTRSTFCQTAGWLATDYPDPQAQPGACGFSADRSATVTPTTDLNVTWVCDPDNVLTIDEAILLDNFLKSIFYQSPCDCKVDSCPGGDVIPSGYLIGVAVVDRMSFENYEGRDFQPINVIAGDFAKATRLNWFSKQGCDDSAVVFYSRFSNEMYISLGKKMEEVVSDLELASLYDLERHYFQIATSSTTFDGAGTTTSVSVYLGLDAILRQLHEAIDNGPSISSDVVFAFTIPLLLLVLLTVMCLISNICCSQDMSIEPTRRSRMSKVSR
ncbi:uncharacterized protein LOC117293003 [Asterias rubens]|uniref:uncharacterized protein LOC117293003 n=1 Tax=Asterias rubens TaxID=7604 RepID=UPI001455922D|nr:uncharacterized protein LOC117293003 [Asterias rubens]